MNRLIAGAAAAVVGSVTFASVPAHAACSVTRKDCSYICIEYYPNGVDCRKTRRVCEDVCTDFDVDISGDTPHRRFKR